MGVKTVVFTVDIISSEFILAKQSLHSSLDLAVWYLLHPVMLHNFDMFVCSYIGWQFTGKLQYSLMPLTRYRYECS